MGSDFHSRLRRGLRRENKTGKKHEVWPLHRRHVKTRAWLGPHRARGGEDAGAGRGKGLAQSLGRTATLTGRGDEDTPKSWVCTMWSFGGGK